MIIYTDIVQWYCEECGDEGESESQSGAEAQVARHNCVGED